MSLFSQKIITNKGASVAAALLNGGVIEFTRIAIGDGVCSGEIESLNALVGEKKSLSINSITSRNSEVVLSTTLLQKDVTEDFYWREVGVFAKGSDGVEVLYMYANSTEPSYISKDTLDEKTINVGVVVSGTENVSAVIDSGLIYVTMADLDEHNTNPCSHMDIREMIQNIDLSKVTDVVKSEHEKTKSHITSQHESTREIIISKCDGVAGTVASKCDSVKSSVATQHESTKSYVSSKIDSALSTINSWIESVKSHVTSQHTVTKTHVSNERANIVNAVNSARDALVSKSNGDICGKIIRLEKVDISGIRKGINVLKSYSNSKGGFVRISPYINNVSYLTLTVDGVDIFRDLHTGYVFGRYESSGNATGADGTAFDVPFNQSFVLTGGNKDSNSTDTSVCSYSCVLTYYLNN